MTFSLRTKLWKVCVRQARFGLFCWVALTLGACGGASSGTGSSKSGTQLATSNPTQGTESSAGGGLGVVCFTDVTVPDQIRAAGGDLEDRFIDGIKSIEMLDLYQAREKRGAQDTASPELMPIGDSESPHEYVLRTSKRFENFIPGISWVIDDGIQQFPPNTIFYASEGLSKINDALFEEKLAPGCVLATMALQTGLEKQSQLKIDSRLFYHPKNTKLSQAVLLLHEYFYVVARKFGSKDSALVRKIIGYLVTRTPQYRISELMTLLKQQHPANESMYQFMGAPQELLRKVVWLFLSEERRLFPVYMAKNPDDQKLLDRVHELFAQADQKCMGLPEASKKACRNAVPAKIRELPEGDAMNEARIRLSAALTPRFRLLWQFSEENRWVQQTTWLSPIAKATWDERITQLLIPALAGCEFSWNFVVHDDQSIEEMLVNDMDFYDRVNVGMSFASLAEELPDLIGPPLD